MEELNWVFSDGPPNAAFWEQLGQAVKSGYLDWVLIPLPEQGFTEDEDSAKVLFRG